MYLAAPGRKITCYPTEIVEPYVGGCVPAWLASTNDHTPNRGPPMIRPTQANDFDALIDIATASGLFEPDQTEMLAGMLRSPSENDVWFTDEDANGPVGVAYLAPEKMTNGTWNLLFIAVHPNHQRQGRGKTILKHVQDWLRLKGERILLVETAGLDDFDYVRTFYASDGFETEARVRDFYDSGVDKVIFRKSLI